MEMKTISEELLEHCCSEEMPLEVRGDCLPKMQRGRLPNCARSVVASEGCLLLLLLGACHRVGGLETP